MATFLAGLIALFIGGASIRIASAKVAFVLVIWALIVGLGSFMEIFNSWYLVLPLAAVCLGLGLKFAPK